jgi:two-component system, OmpR family, heavy metal sensor histidine kinase CusS
VRNSLRGALIAGTSIGAAAVFTVAGVILYFLLRANLVAEIDHALYEKARLLSSSVEVEMGSVRFESDWTTNQRDQPGSPRDYVELWSGDAEVQYCSLALEAANLRPFGSSFDSPDYRWITLPGGIEGRAIGVTFQVLEKDEHDADAESNSGGRGQQTADSQPRMHKEKSAGIKVTLVEVHDAAPLATTLAHIKIVLFSVGAIATAAVVVLMVIIIGRTLRPLDRLASEINQLDADDLTERIGTSTLPAELLPLVDRLNGLLARLSGVLNRERAFSAEVAHELRTPLAGLRSTIDVTMARPRNSAEYAEALSDCQAIIVQMQTMVENLLFLARLEAGNEQCRRQPLSLSQLIADEWATFATAAQERSLRLQWDVDADLHVDADAAQSAILIRNLYSNAVRYANFGGWIRITVRHDGEHVLLSVANSGSEVSSDHSEDVFERFWRGDAARSEVGEHFGLGLPLAKRIVTAMGGSICARTEAGGEFEIVVKLPCARVETEVPSRPRECAALVSHSAI